MKNNVLIGALTVLSLLWDIYLAGVGSGATILDGWILKKPRSLEGSGVSFC